MPKKSFALEPGGPERVTLYWRGAMNDLEVAFDGYVVLTAAGLKELRSGRTAELPDGSTLEVRLQSRFLGSGVVVLRDGVPLPGSSTDPAIQLRSAVIVVYILAGLNGLVGAIALLLDIEFLQNLGFGVLTIAIGVLYAGLGYFAGKRSAVALAAAIALLAFDGLAGIVMTLAAGQMPPLLGLALRFVFLVVMVQGYKAIGHLRTVGAEEAF